MQNNEPNTKPLYKVLNEQLPKGDIYFYDSTKKRWGGYKVGEWIQMELAQKLSNKKLDTRSIGKLSFTGLAGNDSKDYAKAEAFLEYTSLCVNNLHVLADALEGFIHWWDNSGQPDECRNNAMNAKEALSKIS